MTEPALTPTTGRSALCPPECPIDFVDVNEYGEQLLIVYGPPLFATWSAAYRANSNTQPCLVCLLPIEDDTAHVLVHRGRAYWAHPLCAIKMNATGVTSMATYRHPEHPDCAACGEPWADHESAGWCTPAGIRTRSCPSGDGSQLYEYAPGFPGVGVMEWHGQAVAA